MSKAAKNPKPSLHDLRVRLGLLLASEQVRGAIILLSITLEANLNTFLCGYFVHESKRGEFERIVLSKMTIAQKIDVLKNINFPNGLKSFPQLINIYRGMNRLRNHCAHAHWDDGESIVKLADNEFIRQFVTLSPDPVTATTTRVRRLFASLARSNTYQIKEIEFTDENIPF